MAQIIEYTRDDIDKSTWGVGAWMNEPDKIQFVDEASDMDCLMVRNPHSGFWCGYVGTTQDHPFFNVAYGDISVSIDVHGGLTFSAFCHEDPDPAKGVCHVPFSGRAERVWWLGFDCAHSGDLCPGYDISVRNMFGHDGYQQYRSRFYVETECRNLAKQLADPLLLSETV